MDVVTKDIFANEEHNTCTISCMIASISLHKSVSLIWLTYSMYLLKMKTLIAKCEAPFTPENQNQVFETRHYAYDVGLG